jgi:hypothetical protein
MRAPEPWTRVRVETPTYYVYQIVSGESHLANIAGWTNIGTLCPTTEENARLICQAPSLLRVMKDLLEWSVFTGGWDAPCWQEAEALIAGLPPSPPNRTQPDRP